MSDKTLDLAMASRLAWRREAEDAQAKLAEAVEVLRAVNEFDAQGYAVSPMNFALRQRIEEILKRCDVGGTGRG